MQLNNQQNQIQFTPEAKKTYYRLQQIEKELQNIASYGSACDELLNLMSDNCVYNAYCEIAFLKCLLIVGEKARYFGVWSGSQILKKARENCAVLSSEVQAAIIELYTELNSSVRKEKPTSGTSSSFTQPQPLTATTPVATTPVATTPVATTPVATTPVATTPSASTQTQTNYNNSTEVAISDMDSVLYNTSFPETPTALHSNSPGHSSIASPATQPENSAFILSDRNLINLHNQQNATHQSPSPRTQATFTNPVPFVPTPISQSFATIYPSHYPHPSWTQYNPNIQQQQLQHQIPANNQVIYAIPPSPTQLQYNPHQTSGQHIYRQQHQQQQRSHDFAPIFNTNPGQINSQKLASTMASSTHLSSTSKANQQNTTQYMQSAQFQYPANQSPMRQRAPQQESQNITQQQHHERFMRMKQQQLLQQHLQHHLYQQQQQQQQQQQYHHQIATSSPIYNIYQQQPQSITPNTNFQAQGLNSANIQQSINEQLLNDFSYIFAATESNGTSADNTAPKVPRSSSESLPATPPAQKQRFVTPCLPSIPQPSHDQSLLPTKMTAIGDPKDEVDTKDLALFPKLILNLVEPFHLIHGQKITDKYFSIATNQYNNLYSERNKVVQPNRGLPLVIILTAWQVKAEKKMCWPDHIRISVNNHMLQLEKKRSIEGRSATYIGKDKPYDLKNVLKDGKNHIRLFQDNCACTYRFCVRLYVRESEHYILERVKQKELPVKMGKDMIDILLGKKPGNDNDDEIAIKQSSVKVNLKCPFSFRRMKTPVKGLRCKHVACFDLHNYLTSNKTEYPNWICPHCNEICTSDNLAHDLFFGELLKVLPKNVAEIEFKDDHSNIRITKEDDDDDDDDSIKYNDDEEDEIKNDYNRKEGKIQKVENNIEVVDLISDEEEDDNNTAKRQKLM